VHAVTFVVAAALLVVLALRRAPSWRAGALHGLAGVLVLALTGYAWLLLLWFQFALVAPLFHALGASDLRDAWFLVYWLPPGAIALLVVLLLGRRRPAAAATIE
jgi:hypothetical protein